MTRNTRTALKNFTARNLHFRRIFTLLMYILLLDVAFIFLYPFLYMVITSFKSYDDLNDISVKWLLNSFDVTNYTTAAQLLNYFRGFSTRRSAWRCARWGMFFPAPLLDTGSRVIGFGDRNFSSGL